MSPLDSENVLTRYFYKFTSPLDLNMFEIW
jgi:hypothetical protein